MIMETPTENEKQTAYYYAEEICRALPQRLKPAYRFYEELCAASGLTHEDQEWCEEIFDEVAQIYKLFPDYFEYKS